MIGCLARTAAVIGQIYRFETETKLAKDSESLTRIGPEK